PVAGDWDLLADGRFALLHAVTIQLGLGPTGGAAPDQRAYVMHGYITTVEARIGEKRVPDSTLEIHGLDASCLMHFEERTRVWSDLTDADIVRAIYTEYGFGADIDPTPTTRSKTRGPFVQRSTDAELIRLLARRNGFEAYVERTDGPIKAGAATGTEVVGHFHLPRVGQKAQPELSLLPKETPSLLDLSARWESHRPAVVAGAHIDERTRRIRSTRVTESPYPRMGSTSRADILKKRFAEVLPNKPTIEASFRQSVDVPYEQAEVESLARHDFGEADWLVEARGTVNAVRYATILRARRPVSLKGAGRLLDGTWYVRSTQHRWMRHTETKRYEVDVDLVRNALNGVG
ncbi:MAG: contractile injection system protein, VgrG/Pvc8 family, partial [Byssovorax sp.]